jgi:hypothetical protein
MAALNSKPEKKEQNEEFRDWLFTEIKRIEEYPKLLNYTLVEFSSVLAKMKEYFMFDQITHSKSLKKVWKFSLKKWYSAGCSRMEIRLWITDGTPCMSIVFDKYEEFPKTNPVSSIFIDPNPKREMIYWKGCPVKFLEYVEKQFKRSQLIKSYGI